MDYEVRRGSGRKGRININGMKPQMSVEDIDFNTIYVSTIPHEADIQIFGYVREWKKGAVGYSVLEEAADRPDLSECGVFWMRPEDFVKVFKVYGKRSDNCSTETGCGKSANLTGGGKSANPTGGGNSANLTGCGNSANLDSIFDFRDKIKADVLDHVPHGLRDGLVLEDVERIKINDQKLVGIVFQRDEGTACPAFYLNDPYENYIHGMPISNISKQLADAYAFSVSGTSHEMDEKFRQDTELDFDDMKGRLAIKVLETGRNREFLKTVPHKEIGNGFAVVFDVQTIIGGNDEWRMPVTNDVLEKAGIDEEVLFDAAMSNVNEVDPAVLMSLDRQQSGKKVKNLLENDKSLGKGKQVMYVLTNRSGKYGAATLFYPGMQEKIAKRLGDSYYAVPTSLHEFVIVPEGAGADMERLCDMIKADNEFQAKQEDVLSDNILHYDRKWKQIICVNEMLGSDTEEN